MLESKNKNLAPDNLTSEWLTYGWGNTFLVIAMWSIFVAGLLCLLWGLFGGVGVFPKPPTVIVNHFKFFGSWKDQQLKTTALHQDLYSPMQVEGVLQGIQTIPVNDDDDSKYATQAIVLLQGTTVSVSIPEDEEFELKVEEPIQLYYYRHADAYGWKPIGKWKYYWDIWTARIALTAGSLLLVVLLGFLLFRGCKAVFGDIPEFLREATANSMTQPKETAKVVVVRTWMFVIMWAICIIAGLDQGSPTSFSYWILGGLLLHALGRYVNLKTKV